MSWNKPAKDLDDALEQISSNCSTLQLEHRLDPYANEVVNFERAAGDKLANPFLRDEGVEKICEALKTNTSVRALDLSGNRMGSAGVRAICQMLRTNEVIEEVYLEDNEINDEDCEMISSMMRHNETVTALSLSGNKITSDGAKSLANMLRKNATLKSLWLNRNEIRDGGAKELGRALKKNSTLETLCMEDNKVRERGAKVLAKGLRKNSQMETLNLGRNKIGANGAKYFAKTLKKGRDDSHMRTLILDGNRLNKGDLESLECKASAKGVKLQGRTYFDQYGDKMEHLRKRNLLERSRTYLKYHTKPKYLKHGHYNPNDEIKKVL